MTKTIHKTSILVSILFLIVPSYLFSEDFQPLKINDCYYTENDIEMQSLYTVISTEEIQSSKYENLGTLLEYYIPEFKNNKNYRSNYNLYSKFIFYIYSKKLELNINPYQYSLNSVDSIKIYFKSNQYQIIIFPGDKRSIRSSYIETTFKYPAAFMESLKFSDSDLNNYYFNASAVVNYNPKNEIKGYDDLIKSELYNTDIIFSKNKNQYTNYSYYLHYSDYKEDVFFNTSQSNEEFFSKIFTSGIEIDTLLNNFSKLKLTGQIENDECIVETNSYTENYITTNYYAGTHFNIYYFDIVNFESGIILSKQKSDLLPNKEKFLKPKISSDFNISFWKLSLSATGNYRDKSKEWDASTFLQIKTYKDYCTFTGTGSIDKDAPDHKMLYSPSFGNTNLLSSRRKLLSLGISSQSLEKYYINITGLYEQNYNSFYKTEKYNNFDTEYSFFKFNSLADIYFSKYFTLNLNGTYIKHRQSNPEFYPLHYSAATAFIIKAPEIISLFISGKLSDFETDDLKYKEYLYSAALNFIYFEKINFHFSGQNSCSTLENNSFQDNFKASFSFKIFF